MHPGQNGVMKHTIPSLPTTAAALLAALLPTVASAAPAASRIDKVTVYPGTAQVERVTRVAAGAREVVLGCLSTDADLASLQLEADAGVRIGPVTATTVPRQEAPACNTHPLDPRIEALEDRIAQVHADIGARELLLAQLKGNSTGPGVYGSGPASAGGLAATLNLVQRTAQEQLQQLQPLRRQAEQLERELTPLQAERARQQNRGQVRELVIQVSARADGDLRLRYLVQGPTWAPSYRATLDSSAGHVDMERLAQVRQTSGEDWSGVSLRLSTGSPRASVQGPQPRTWQVSPRPREDEMLFRRSAAMPAPAPAMAEAAALSDAAPEPDFAVQVAETGFATEFEVPGRVDVRSGGQSVAFALDAQRWPATTWVQTLPERDASAWLVAEIARPAGVWPDGRLQLLRDRQVVGNSVWRSQDGANQAKLTLPFGRDDQVRVRNLPVTTASASSGFIGQRSERRTGRLFEVENRHRTPVEIEVLDSSPVPTDEQITVVREFDPQPQTTQWNEQPGIVAWRQRLTPGQTARFSASYRLSYPKDMPLLERR